MDSIQNKYTLRQSDLLRLRDEVEFVINKKITEASIPIHLIEGRIKTLQSIIGKMQRLGEKSQFESITDLCGLRIICLFSSDQEKIVSIVRSLFDIISYDDKKLSMPYDRFGYVSIHLICKIPKSFSGPRYNGLHDLIFEIQVRTITSHAWATISHYLDYKSSNSIPERLRKDFYALSAIFHLADRQFEYLSTASAESKNLISKLASDKSVMSNLPIDHDSLSEFLHATFPDRKHADSSLISEFIDEIVSIGYKTIGQLQKDVIPAISFFKQFEVWDNLENFYGDLAVVRGSLMIANDKYFNARKKNNENFDLDLQQQYLELKSEFQKQKRFDK